MRKLELCVTNAWSREKLVVSESFWVTAMVAVWHYNFWHLQLKQGHLRYLEFWIICQFLFIHKTQVSVHLIFLPYHWGWCIFGNRESLSNSWINMKKINTQIESKQTNWRGQRSDIKKFIGGLIYWESPIRKCQAFNVKKSYKIVQKDVKKDISTEMCCVPVGSPNTVNSSIL